VRDALLVSNLLLWTAVFVLLVVVTALARQIGILYERIAPMGALMMDNGPKVGEPAPLLRLPALNGREVQIGSPGPRSTLVFFLSPTCPVCKKLLPIVKAISRAERRWLDVMFASDGAEHDHEAFVHRTDIGNFDYVLSAELGMRFHVSKLPYAVLIDHAGVVRSKGLVNSREQIESLFRAHDMNVASVQAYLDRPALAKGGA
jgi:methylamine dehydrogenase accessory protein MauD